MGIASVTEISAGRSMTFDSTWKRTYKRVFRVITDSPTTEQVGVFMALTVPPGTPYRSGSAHDDGAFANSYEITDEGKEDGKSWIATVNYGPYDPTLYPIDPTMWIPRVSWTFAQFTRTVDFEAGTGEAITNAAKDPYDPGIQADDSRPVLQIVRNELGFDINLADEYRDTINDAPFWGFPAKAVKCSCITANWLYNADIACWYWEVTYEFHFNRDTWDYTVINQGFRELDSSGTKKRAILDDYGVPVSKPWPLDDNGVAIQPGSSTPIGAFDFQIYKKKDFSNFGFDDLYNAITAQNQAATGNPWGA